MSELGKPAKIVVTETNYYVPFGSVESTEPTAIETGYWIMANGKQDSFEDDLPEYDEWIKGGESEAQKHKTDWEPADNDTEYHIAIVDECNINCHNFDGEQYAEALNEDQTFESLLKLVDLVD